MRSAQQDFEKGIFKRKKRLQNVESGLYIPEEVGAVEEIDGGYSVKTVAEKREHSFVIRDLHITTTAQRNAQVNF